MNDAKDDTPEIADVPLPGTTESLTNRAEQLKAEALRQVRQARTDKDAAMTAFENAEDDERDAVKAALAIGFKRKELAEHLGVSASWVSNMARREG